MKELVIFLISLILGAFLLFKLVKRGISKKYDRKPKDSKEDLNSWSALNEGVDPSL